MVCEHIYSISHKLTENKLCSNCDCEITVGYRGICCEDCRIIKCVNCYSYEENLLIDPEEIDERITIEEVYCNSCLVLLKRGFSKKVGVVEKEDHILCERCIERIDEEENTNIKNKDLVILKNNYKQKLEISEGREKIALQNEKEEFEDKINGLEEIESEEQERLDRLEEDIVMEGNVFNRYKEYVEDLLKFKEIYEQEIYELENKVNLQDESVEDLVEIFIKNTPKEKREGSNEKTTEIKVEVLEAECVNEQKNIEDELNNESFYFQKKFEELENSENKKIKHSNILQERKLQEFLEEENESVKMKGGELKNEEKGEIKEGNKKRKRG